MILTGALTLAANMFLAPVDINSGAENDILKTESISTLEQNIKTIKTIATSENSEGPVDLTYVPEEDTELSSLLEGKTIARKVSAKKHTYDEMKKNDKTGFDFIYKQASEAYGIPWQVLSAVHMVETGRRGDTSIGSYAGAMGPMQFMPATFARYGVDGDGDGVARITDSDDAIYSAANYLRASGGTTDIRRGLFAYNHSTAYVNKVLGIAYSLGYTG